MTSNNFTRECPFCWHEFAGLTCPNCNTVVPTGSEKTYVAQPHDHHPGDSTPIICDMHYQGTRDRSY